MRRPFSLLGLILVMFVLSDLSLSANITTITNVGLVPEITQPQGSATIQFPVIGENSSFVTTCPVNYDAAWLFMNRKKSGSSASWEHRCVSKMPRECSGAVITVVIDSTTRVPTV